MATKPELALDLNATEESDEYTESSEESEELPMKSPVSALVLGGAKRQTYDEESDIHDDITLTLEFPDGKKRDVRCKTGETIINLKKKIFDEFEIPFSCKLTYNDSQMLDPLSLNDFPELIEASKHSDKIDIKITL